MTSGIECGYPTSKVSLEVSLKDASFFFRFVVLQTEFAHCSRLRIFPLNESFGSRRSKLSASFPLFSILLPSVVVVVTRALPRDGDTVEDHGAPEAWQLSRAWTRGRRETESRQ